MIVRESLFYLQVCCESPPENFEHGGFEWYLNETIPPVKCEKYPERMHYILNCGKEETNEIS